jgi:predicted DNA-binding protein
MGEQTEKPKPVTISIRFSPELAEEVRALSEEQSRSFNGTVIEACKRYVRQWRPRSRGTSEGT